MANKKTVEHFSKRFIEYLIIDWDPNSVKVSPIEQIKEVKKWLMDEFEIDTFNADDENAMRSYIEKNHPRFLRDNQLDDAQELVRVLIMEKAEINVQEQQQYLELVKNFQISQRIEDLYYFGDILDDDLSIVAENTLKQAIKDLDNKNKAELLASISIYLESLSQTQQGMDFIRSLREKDPYQWFNELFDDMQKSSPLSPCFDYVLEEGKIKHQTQRSGLFDGLYYALKEDETTGQLQISATSSVDANWENNSILRYALSSAIINKALDEYFFEWAENEIGLEVSQNMADYEHRLEDKAIELIQDTLMKKDFMPYDEEVKDSNRNYLMATTIKKATERLLSTEFDSFDSMILHLTQNTNDCLRNALNIDKNQRYISENDINELINGCKLFVGEGYFVNYSPSSVSLDLGFKETTLWNNVVSAREDRDSPFLTPEEFKAKAQYIALKTHNLRGEDLDNDALATFFEQYINLRALNQKSRIDNSRLENDQAFENILINHFVLETPENIENNFYLLDQKTSNNVGQYVKDWVSFLNKNNYQEKLKKVGIDYKGSFYELIEHLSQVDFKDRYLMVNIQDKKMLEETKNQLEHTNEQLEQTNEQLEQTSEQLEQTSEEFEQISIQLEMNLINQGLMYINLDETKYNNFLEREDITQEQEAIIESLKEHFNGEDKKATFEDIKKNKRYR